jgi:hypothetical protein
MSDDRPDWFTCVSRVTNARTTTWCGRGPGSEFRFMNIDHAAENGASEGRLVACPACVAEIVKALRNGSEAVDVV